MKLKVSRVDVWAATVEDRAGGLAEKLEPLAAAGATLEFMIARRSPENPGQGVVFLTPLRGPVQLSVAKKAGFVVTPGLHSVRIEGPDRPGLAAKMTRALAAAGISLRGFSATALDRTFVAYLALDEPEQAAKAIRVVRRLS